MIAKEYFKKIIAGLMVVFLTLPVLAFAETKEELESQLQQIESQISQYENELSKTQSDKKTLTNKISQLKKEQQKTALQIKATNIKLKEIGKQLTTTEDSIQTNIEKLDDSKKQAAEIIRTLYKQNQKSLVEVLMESNSFSDFLGELYNIEKLSEQLADTIGSIKETKANLEVQHSDLETQQDEKKDILSVQVLQNQALQAKTGEQNLLLKETQGKESTYQKMIADSRKQANEIRNRIYQLLGVKTQITFGQAVDIAKWVSGQTGVRAELLLAVLTQESNLGQNVGTCNRAGDPASKGWQVIMKPGRDQEPFLSITGELGLDPNVTPVSCPMRDSRGNKVGWGGAMGPAQFIPSTWVLYKDKISAIVGKTANPWDTKDAFVAAALLLKDNGAASGNKNAEWRAAMLYFSGSTNTRFRFYGDNVLALAKRYESDIQELS